MILASNSRCNVPQSQFLAIFVKATKEARDAEFVRFLRMAKGSLSELVTQLEIALEVGLIKEELVPPIEQQCKKVGSMLTKLIRARRSGQ